MMQSDPVRVFAKAVLHGDDEHKAWLLEAAEAFIAGKPLPPPRGKGTKQSDAEPVAWRLYFKPGSLGLAAITELRELADEHQSWGWKVEPLYAAPPRPDASAGLIEAADLAEEYARLCYHNKDEQIHLEKFARHLRARAADRSTK